jgi:hypothetical protein
MMFTLTRATPKGRSETVVIKVTDPVEVDYGQFAQSVLAHVESGPAYLLGQTVYVKIYDPL